MIKDFFFWLRCWLSHRHHHISVGAGFQLCQICDARLLEALIKKEAE